MGGAIPYTVVLLDEMEKAHPDVAELFYQVFDRGTMEDAARLVPWQCGSTVRVVPL